MSQSRQILNRRSRAPQPADRIADDVEPLRKVAHQNADGSPEYLEPDEKDRRR
jgi:hypothetical protein